MITYGVNRHKQLKLHQLNQAHLPAQFHQLGWQLFQYQNFWHAWHLPSLAHTIGHQTIPPLVIEIYQWSQFLGLLACTTEEPDQQQNKRFNEYAAILHLIKPAKKGQAYVSSIRH